MTATSEFALIDVFLAAFAQGRPSLAAGSHAPAQALVLGPGDDAALLRIPAGELLVATTDTLVSGRHFLPAMPAELVGWRALAVNLSDLAAMGARPAGILVALTLPEADASWLQHCGRGMGALAHAHGVALAGGNMSQGKELSISVTALGSVREEAALRRSGASVGDRVYVSGRIGCAGAGLQVALQIAALARSAQAWPSLADALAAHAAEPGALQSLACYVAPQPRCDLGAALRGVASAAVDVSDGLLADLGHLCAASGVAAEIVTAQVPLTDALAPADALRAGDDYELCFTVRPALEHLLPGIAAAVRIALTRVGVLTPGSGVWLDGQRVADTGGYRHFA